LSTTTTQPIGAANDVCDVIATEISSGLRRVMATNKTPDDAEAFIRMAIIRRGVEHEIYSSVPTGSVESATFADEDEQAFCQRMEQDFERNGTTP
jgi:hypothetical protein